MIFQHVSDMTVVTGRRPRAELLYLGRAVAVAAPEEFLRLLTLAWQSSNPEGPAGMVTPRLIDDPPLALPAVGLICDWCGSTIDIEPQVTFCSGCAMKIDWGNPEVLKAAEKAKYYFGRY